MARDVKCNKCGALNYSDNGKCLSCGAFVKGNKQGEHSRRRDAVKYALRDAITPKEAKELLRELLYNNNENVQLKALELFLNRLLGKSVTPIVTNPDVKNTHILSDKVRKLRDDLLDPVEEEDAV